MCKFDGSLAKSLAVCMAFLLTGCATFVDAVPPDFVPNAHEGLIYGRMEFVVDGKTLPPDTRYGLVKPMIRSSISRFTSIRELNENGWKAGEFAFDAAVSDAGDFVARLPVGRYYFVEFDYFGPGNGIPMWRTYADTFGVRLMYPTIYEFDVLPGKATYIGSMRHLVDYGAAWTSGQVVYFDLTQSDDSVAATARLLDRSPKLRGITESKLVVSEKVDTPPKLK